MPVRLLVAALFVSPRPADGQEAGRPRRSGVAATVPVSRTMLETGRSLYAEHCVSCHGPGAVSGAAGEGMYKALDVTNAEQMDALTDAAIARKILFGGFQMPAYPQIRGDDLAGLVAYVRLSLVAPGAQARPRGKRAFRFQAGRGSGERRRRKGLS